MTNKPQATDKQLGHELWNDQIRAYFDTLLLEHSTVDDALQEVDSMLRKNTLCIKIGEGDEVEIPLDDHVKSLLDYSRAEYLFHRYKDEKYCGKALDFLDTAKSLYTKAHSRLKDCESSKCNVYCLCWIRLGDITTAPNLVTFHYETAMQTGCKASIEAAEKLATYYKPLKAFSILITALKQANAFFDPDFIGTISAPEAVKILDSLLEKLQQLNVSPISKIVQQSKFWKALAHRKMGNLLLAKHMYSEIAFNETRFKRSNSKFANDARQNSADIYFSWKKFKTAKEISQIVLEYRRAQKDAHMVNSMVALADAHKELGEFEEAKDLYREALSKLGHSPRSDSDLVNQAKKGLSECENLGEEEPAEDAH